MPKRPSHYSEDLSEFRARDKKRTERKEILRKVTYQSITFFLCFAKLYYISLLQGAITFNRQEFEKKRSHAHDEFRVAFLVGMLAIGNIIDNIPSPKYLAIAL